MRYESSAQVLILAAGEQARSLGHSFVGSQHLLLAFGKDDSLGGKLLRGAGFDPDLAVKMAVVLYGVGTPGLPLPQGMSAQLRKILSAAMDEAKLRGSRELSRIHIFLAMLRQNRCSARDLLVLSGVDPEDLFTRTVDYLNWKTQLPEKRKREGTTTKLLEQFSEDLLAKAANMEPVIGREREIDMVIGILSRKNKNNPALVGEPGVGKTAIAEGLAQRMAAGNVPPQLRTKNSSA